VQPSYRRLVVRRTVAVLAILSVLALGLVVRLTYLQVIAGSIYGQAALAEQYAHLPLPPVRGSITDRNGRVLALETPGEALWAMPRSIRDPRTMARQLGPILGESAAKLEKVLASRQAFVWLSYHVTVGQAARIQALGTYDGLGLQPVSWRIYPQGDLAGAAIGFVGVDQTGLAGVELSYNKQLSGKPGTEVVKVDALGNPLPQYGVHVTPAVPGDGLETTLDLSIQAFAQQDLAAAVKLRHAKGGRILVLNPNTGGILAIAQYPEPNPANWQNYPQTEWADEPIQYAFEPGSTIKPVTASAALTTGVATPSWSIMDKGSMVIDGIRIFDWIPTGFGRLTFDGIMEESSDVGFATLAIDMGASALYHFYDLFHLDRLTGVDLPGETPGLIPPENQATKLDLGEMGFGQTIAISPIQLAAAVSAVADGGIWHTPHIGKALLLPDGGKQVLSFPSQRVITPLVASEVRTAMLKVVTKGTGNLAQVKGYEVAGKTGTANVVGKAGKFKTGDFLASFIGYGPLPNPKVLILVQLDDPKGLFYGGDVSAPVFSQLFGQIMDYMGVPTSTAALQAQRVSVPDLAGLTYAEAALRLDGLGLLMQGQGSGTKVTSQTPASGVKVAPNTLVTVQLGGSKGSTGVPDVLGLTVQQADRALASRGYRMVPSGSGVAAHQKPGPGTALKSGQSVTVVFTAPP
jgi:stage V sporulation protein D (sporulation-specific penicillin-binding protein)